MSAVPEGVTVEELPGCLRISLWNVAPPQALALAVTAVMLAGWLGALWLQLRLGHFPWALWPFWVLSLGVAWTQLELLLKRTVFELRAGTLSISVGPLQHSQHSRTELAQLSVEEHPITGRDNHFSFTLSALLRDGRKRRLVAGLEERVHALFLQRVIEKRFGLNPQKPTGAVE